MNKLEQYFNGDELASIVWKSKYAIEGEETPDDMHERMANELGRVESNYYEKSRGQKYDNLSDFGQRILTTNLDKDLIKSYFKNFKYIVPQGSIMSMLGNKYKIGSLSNCFVIGQPHDSYGGILQKDQELVQLMKRRGGVGIDISTLRPDTVPVSNAAGSSTGAVSFMHRFSNSTREVAQNGRRGALMITIDCRHPDLLNFLNIKKDLTQVTGANISVQLRDDFMKAVVKDDYYVLRFPCDTSFKGISTNDLPFDELVDMHGQDGIQYAKKIKAREYFGVLVENNWLSAEPGLMFVDKHWNYSPDGVYTQYRGVTTNPCGEIFMQMYDACRLLALNLFNVIDNPFTKKASVNWDELYEISYIQQRLADDIVDLEIEHIDRILEKIENDDEPDEVKETEKTLWKNIRKVASSGRRTGCGFTALGDMVAALGFKYDSKEAKKIIDQVCKKKLEAELDCTIDLAILRGTFEGWNKNLEFEYVDTNIENVQQLKGKNEFYDFLAQNFKQAKKLYRYGRRNVSWNTVAPTGTVSLMTQTTSGLEPLFSPYYFRNKKVNPGEANVRIDYTDQNSDSWMEYPVLHQKFKDWYLQNVEIQKARIEKEDPNRDINWTPIEQLTKEQLDVSFKKSPYYQSTANDIDWIERVEIQAIIQKYTTHSISSTINLPEDVKKDKIFDIYIRAWESGLKGVTVYRDKCRSGVLVTESNKNKEGFEYKDAPKRPQDLPCDIYSTTAKGIKWNVIVGLFDKKPYEVFAIPHFTNESKMTLRKMTKGRYDLLNSDNEVYSENVTSEMTDEESALTRMISTALRHGSNIDFIVEQLNKSHGTVVSFSKAVARVLSKYSKAMKVKGENCPECGEDALVKEEGCTKCKNCGYNKC